MSRQGNERSFVGQRSRDKPSHSKPVATLALLVVLGPQEGFWESLVDRKGMRVLSSLESEKQEEPQGVQKHPL